MTDAIGPDRRELDGGQELAREEQQADPDEDQAADDRGASAAIVVLTAGDRQSAWPTGFDLADQPPQPSSGSSVNEAALPSVRRSMRTAAVSKSGDCQVSPIVEQAMAVVVERGQ